MAKKQVQQDPVLIKERKRRKFFALPWSFTTYSITSKKLIYKKGFLNSYEDEIPELHLASRYGMAPDSYSYKVRFRCAKGIRESVGYDISLKDADEYEPEFAYIKAGNENGIFLLAEPGSGYDTAMIGVIPNGAVVEIVAGPVNINYSEWYQLRTQNGESGWTLASAIVSADDPK